MMWARAKASFVKHGDSNSRSFHAGASMMWATNFISKLRRTDGSVEESEHDIQLEIVDFFSKVFSSIGNLDIDGVVAHAPSKVTEGMNLLLCVAYND